ncbi:MAG: adenine-specific methyltransferase EcoRI family protein [Akkermansia sp.]|nr:adenine-specific methyltransferase EcoRI family protein [Akkermansia sp.]
MAKNTKLSEAKSKKNDEFYTQYADIEKEVNAYLEYDPDTFRGKTVLLPCDDPEWSNFTIFFAQNFARLGLKKLISTSYAPASKNFNWHSGPTEFEQESPLFDCVKSKACGKIFVLEKDITGDGIINHDDLEWNYLDGDGDFRSEVVCKLRDESDIIVTNPPFSLFREFLAWLVQGGKKFLMIGNMNAITYKEVFPLLKDNQMWLGNGFAGGNAYFMVPEGTAREYATGVYDAERGMVHFRNCAWFTNMEHGKRHRPLELMSLQDNLKFSRHKDIKGSTGYRKYDNYDAIEVPYTDAIPSDYPGVMGVPISFLDKYCPEQFEIMGMCENEDLYDLKTRVYTRQECKDAYFAKFGKQGSYDLNASGVLTIEGKQEKVYQRILIRKIQPKNKK